jgi:DNA-binding MarR family transcriptional regulator
MSKNPQSRLARMYERPGFLVRRVHQISAGLFELECREISLTPAQFAVISVLAAMPQIDQSGLARAVGYDKVTIMYVLRGLIERGLVARVPANKRAMALSLTKDGVAFLELAHKHTERASAVLLSPFTENQRAQFIKLLKILTVSLEEKARAPLVMPDLAVEQPEAV